MQKVNMRFPEKLLTRIDRQAAREQLDRSNLVRTVMKRYVDEQDEKRKQGTANGR